MRKEHKDIVAILCSDIHLCHKAPVARSAEPDWYAAMKRPLRQLTRLSSTYDCPVVIAGDIFDHWKSPPELINFAIENLPPDIYAIPGQHDLPFHVLDDMDKSAYGTLVRAERIQDISHGHPIALSDKLWIWGFAWGENVLPRNEDYFKGGSGKALPDCNHLAVIHSYIWMKDRSYPGADKQARVGSWQKKLKGYSAAVFGDNHKGFTFGKHLMNCGAFIRRKIDERKYTPQVGLLNKWGRIIPHYLDTSQDKFIDVESAAAIAESGLEMGVFLAELAGLGDTALNFLDSLTRYCKDNGVDKAIRKIILEASEKKE